MSSSATQSLRHADFRRFEGMRLAYNLAMQMATVAVGWEVYDLTHSPLHLGYVGLSQFAPATLFALVGGHVADRFDRRRLVLVSLLALAACAALLAWRSTQQGDLAVIYVVAASLGTCRAFIGPASTALMPRLVPLADFSNAVSWHLIVFQIGMSLGPAMGGLIYGWAGGPAVYGGAVALFLVGLSLAALIRAPAKPLAAPASGLSVFLAGVRYVWQQKVILGAVSLDLFAVLLGGAVALLPIFARDVLHVGPTGLGFLRAAPALGAALTALYLAHRPIQRRLGRALFAGVALFGAATAAFGLSQSFALSLAALFVVGAADMASVTVRHLLIQLTTPDDMRGRVSAVTSIFVGASNELGEMESGLVAAWLGAVRAVVAGGLGACAIVALWTRLFPQLLRVDAIEPVSESAA